MNTQPNEVVTDAGTAPRSITDSIRSQGSAIGAALAAIDPEQAAATRGINANNISRALREICGNICLWIHSYQPGHHEWKLGGITPFNRVYRAHPEHIGVVEISYFDEAAHQANKAIFGVTANGDAICYAN